MAIIYAEGDNPLADGWAKSAAEILVHAYPNHSWWVEVRQGLLIVKHFELSGIRGSIGMVRHLDAIKHNAKVFKQELIRAAGELLERANLKRGANTGETVRTLELDKRLAKYWHAPLVPTKVIH